MKKSGADILADLLVEWEAGPIFHIPGEGILEPLNALADTDLSLISCRHEGGMAYMAQAVGRLTQRPGICLAARVPGALNTTLALHTADTDAAPVIMIIGQASSRISDRDPLLGADLLSVFAPMTKWAAQVPQAARLPEYLARAWHTAISGRAGPVVLVVPEDVWSEQVEIGTLPGRPQALTQHPAPTETAKIAALLARARRPLLLVGGSDWNQEVSVALARFAGALDLPVATAYRRRDMIDHDSPHFVGELGIGADRALVEAVREADLLLVLGMRLGEINTFGGTAFEGFTLLDVPTPAQTLIHVHPAIGELNKTYQAALSICASPAAVVSALSDLPLNGNPAWADWRARLHGHRTAFVNGGTCPGAIDLTAIFAKLRAALPADAIITSGGGAYALWPQRYFPHHHYGTQMGPKSGAMGYGLAAAVGARLAAPKRIAVAIAGDGCFMMHGEELATAVLHDVPVIALVLNNGLYGAINASQKRMFGKTVGTQLSAIDFSAYAHALGANGYVVERTDQFDAVLQACLAGGKPAVIDLRMGPEALRP